MHCRLMKPHILADYPKIISYAFRFIFFKNVSVSLVMSLTIKRNITLHERATDHIGLLKHEESMEFHSRSDETLLHFVFFAQNVF